MVTAYSKLESSEERGFLGHEEDGLQERHSLLQQLGTRTQIVLIHVTALTFNLLACFVFVSWLTPSCGHHSSNSASPLQQSIPRETHRLDPSKIYLSNGTIDHERPPFGGPPREELLEAWKDLTQYMNLRLQPDDLGEFQHDDSIVQLADGSGAFGTLAVYHGIHCVNRFHRYLYWDYYYPDITDSRQVELLKHHTEHCIDWLRQYIQCNIDLTVLPMHWGNNQPLPLSYDSGNHQCLNWEALQEWARERSFDAYQPGLLVHPKFGNPYADGKPNKVGIVEDDSVLRPDGDGTHP